MLPRAADFDHAPSAGTSPLPGPIGALIAESERLMSERRAGRKRPWPGFVACESEDVHRALATIQSAHLAPGPRFCEWGSGFGVVTAMAAWAGFEGHGIEVHGELVAAARAFVDHLGLTAEFVEGTFVPRGGEHLTLDSDNPWWNPGHAIGYEELGLDPEDFDLFYAYPWPGEEHLFDRLFRHYAADGALFLTYNGVSGMRLQRKRGEATAVEITDQL